MEKRKSICAKPKMMILTFYKQGRINHWANRLDVRGLAPFGASRLNIKIILNCFFMFSKISFKYELDVVQISLRNNSVLFF